MRKHDHTPVRDRIVNGERERFCKKHQGWWPLRLFVKHPLGRLGYLGHCAACRRDSRVYEPRPRGPRKAKPRAKVLKDGMFRCRDCKEEKSLDQFHVNRGISRGHGSYCVDCDNARRRARAARKAA